MAVTFVSQTHAIIGRPFNNTADQVVSISASANNFIIVEAIKSFGNATTSTISSTPTLTWTSISNTSQSTSANGTTTQNITQQWYTTVPTTGTVSIHISNTDSSGNTMGVMVAQFTGSTSWNVSTTASSYNTVSTANGSTTNLTASTTANSTTSMLWANGWLWDGDQTGGTNYFSPTPTGWTADFAATCVSGMDMGAYHLANTTTGTKTITIPILSTPTAYTAVGTIIEISGATLPNAPTSVTATADAVGRITVSWTAPATGPAPTEYRIFSTASSGSALGGASPDTIISSQTSSVYTGLTAGVTFSAITVQSGTSAGWSPSSSPAVSATVWNVPGAPTSIVATRGTITDGVNLSWTAPASNGSAITTYNIASTPSVTLTPNSSTSTGVTNMTATWASPGVQSYTFSVSATNAVGTGASGTSNGLVPPQFISQSLPTETLSIIDALSTLGKYIRGLSPELGSLADTLTWIDSALRYPIDPTSTTDSGLITVVRNVRSTPVENVTPSDTLTTVRSAVPIILNATLVVADGVGSVVNNGRLNPLEILGVQDSIIGRSLGRALVPINETITIIDNEIRSQSLNRIMAPEVSAISATFNTGKTIVASIVPQTIAIIDSITKSVALNKIITETLNIISLLQYSTPGKVTFVEVLSTVANEFTGYNYFKINDTINTQSLTSSVSTITRSLGQVASTVVDTLVRVANNQQTLTIAGSIIDSMNRITIGARTTFDAILYLADSLSYVFARGPRFINLTENLPKFVDTPLRFSEAIVDQLPLFGDLVALIRNRSIRLSLRMWLPATLDVISRILTHGIYVTQRAISGEGNSNIGENEGWLGGDAAQITIIHTVYIGSITPGAYMPGS